MPAAPVVKPQRRIWPYIVGTALVAALSSAWYCYHLWTAPIPDTLSDESSAMGEMIVLIIMGVGVIVCTVMGALLGWLIGWMARSRSALPSSERLVRTIFWTLWIVTVSATAYALCVEFFGIGLFLQNSFAPKLHMRGEVRMAFTVSSFAIIGLMITSIIAARWNRSLWHLGLAALAFWLFYISIPRY